MEVVGEYPQQLERTSLVSTPSNPRSSFPDLSSPCRTSAPSNPCREGAIYCHGSDANVPVIPFNWEERPGLPKSYHRSLSNRARAAATGEMEDGCLEFAFELSGLRAGDGGEDDAQTIYADELFESGWIRPLNLIDGSFSGSHCDRIKNGEDEEPRGRNGAILLSSGSRKTGGRRATRSLPPLGRAAATDSVGTCHATAVTETGSAVGSNSTGVNAFYGNTNVSGLTTTVATITEYVKGGIMRWGRENLLLFRSASEGRASSGAKARFASMASSMLLLDHPDAKKGSFRCEDEVGRRATRTSLGGSSRHGPSQEMALYARNRAMDHELGKRRTFLPYKQGLLSFNPSLRGPSSASGPSQSY